MDSKWIKKIIVSARGSLDKQYLFINKRFIKTINDTTKLIPFHK